MNTFAGFWRDGAVVKPEERHCDCTGFVITKQKDTGELIAHNCSKLNPWSDYHWLDTTPRESLTPEELFSVLRVIWPKCENVFDPGVNASVEWQVQLDDTNEQTPITWGNIRQYPSPIEPQWIRITRENVGQYLFRDCRFRDADIDKWNYGKVAGWCETESRTLVNSDFKDEMYVMNWNIVEVQS